jgi:hypothetical protein
MGEGEGGISLGMAGRYRPLQPAGDDTWEERGRGREKKTLALQHIEGVNKLIAYRARIHISPRGKTSKTQKL